MKKKYVTPKFSVYETEHMKFLCGSSIPNGGENNPGISPQCYDE